MQTLYGERAGFQDRLDRTLSVWIDVQFADMQVRQPGAGVRRPEGQVRRTADRISG
jgi:hypothetical protein